MTGLTRECESCSGGGGQLVVEGWWASRWVSCLNCDGRGHFPVLEHELEAQGQERLPLEVDT